MSVERERLAPQPDGAQVLDGAVAELKVDEDGTVGIAGIRIPGPPVP